MAHIYGTKVCHKKWISSPSQRQSILFYKSNKFQLKSPINISN